MTRIREYTRMNWFTNAHRRAAGVVLPLFVGLMAGCMGDNGGAPNVRPITTTLGTIHVSPINAVMAVGDTMSLVVTGQTISGAALTDFDSVQYNFQLPTDTVRLRISSTGLVTARNVSTPNSPVLVNVIAYKDGVATADQALIQVVTTAFPNATLSIQPIPPDSAKQTIQSSKRIIPVIKNVAGQSVSSPVIRYEYGPGDSVRMGCYVPSYQATATLSANQLKLTPCGSLFLTKSSGTNTILPFQTGTAWVHANIRVFGVTLRDSVLYTLTNPYTGSVKIGANDLGISDKSTYRAVIAPGGTITFSNSIASALGASVSWTFDNPAAATAASSIPTYGGSTGNIPPITTTQGSTTRRFMTAGTYNWTATISGGIPPFTGQTITGTITVE